MHRSSLPTLSKLLQRCNLEVGPRRETAGAGFIALTSKHRNLCEGGASLSFLQFFAKKVGHLNAQAGRYFEVLLKFDAGTHFP